MKYFECYGVFRDFISVGMVWPVPLTFVLADDCCSWLKLRVQPCAARLSVPTAFDLVNGHWPHSHSWAMAHGPCYYVKPMYFTRMLFTFSFLAPSLS